MRKSFGGNGGCSAYPRCVVASIRAGWVCAA